MSFCFSAFPQGKGDSFTLGIDFQHPDHHLLTHLDHRRRIPDIAIGQLTDVDQPVLMDADIDKGPEFGDVGDDAGQPLARIAGPRSG